MGISSNQARFLALTSRQVDLENRVQQICQRRLRLSSELEKVATDYNNNIGNRQMFTYNTSNSGISHLSVSGIEGLKDTNGNAYKLLYDTTPTATTRAYSGVTTGTLSTDSTGILSINGAATTYNVGLKSYAAGATTEPALLEAAIRAGVITISTEKDQYTQTSYTVGAKDYELTDWRTLPVIADELYKGDDVDAENKYDRTIAQVNAQDKKLQLEQSSIEVEYKAVTSEKEAVKKILDTNAASSFKYFS